MKNERTGWRATALGMLLGLIAAASASGQQPVPQRAAVNAAATIATGAAARPTVPVGTEQRLRLDGERSLLLTADGLALRTVSSNRPARSWSLPAVRRDASLTLLPSGRVLIWGGRDGRGRLQPGGLWFDPDLQVLEPTDSLPLSPRAGHTTTVLTDGRVLFAGGQSDGATYELWNPDADQWTPLAGKPKLPTAHRAELQADGRVRLYGRAAEGQASSDGRTDLSFDPSSHELTANPANANSASKMALGLAASLPQAGAKDVAIDARLALRFSERVRSGDLNASTVTLFGPGGITATRVVSVENGRLAFVSPLQELFPDTPYTLLVDGLHSQDGTRLPVLALDFRTVALSPDSGEAMGADASVGKSAATSHYCNGKSTRPQLCERQSRMQDGRWTPGQDNAGENWRVPGRQPEQMYLGFMPNLFEAMKLTTLTGSILRVDGQPAADVAVSIGTRIARTNAEGRFWLYDVPSGRQKVYVDGTTANAPGVEYGQFVVGVDVGANTLTQVPFTMYLPRIAGRDKIAIPSPTPHDMVLTHPDLPGMELHLPAGTVVRDHKGKIVTEIAIVPTPVNRAPYPLPTNFPMYFTLQPGGAVLQGLTPEAGKGARVFYPNYDKHPEGTPADFWLYDPMEGWRVYGKGRVTPDETQFAPEPGVALRGVVTFGAAVSPNDPAPEEGMPPDGQECGEGNAGTGCNATAGDPIDLKTGRFSYKETDIVIADTVPIDLTRAYRPSDRVKREFGIGTAGGFSYRLSTKSSNSNEIQLVLPNGTPLVFRRVSGSGSYGSWRYDGAASISGAILTSESSDGWHYRITQRDGSVMVFEPYSPNRLKWMQDRYGNKTEYIYDAGRVSRIVSPNGRWLDLEYDNQNRIVSGRDMLGATWRYEYNDKGMLARVVYPDATTRRYEYKSWGTGVTQEHRLSAIYDQRGARLLLNEYEEIAGITTGRVIKQTLADGGVYTMDYEHLDGSSSGVLVTHPDGSQRRIVFGTGLYPVSDTLAYGTPLAQQYRFERDGLDRMTARIDPLGRRTEYEYDGQGRRIRTTSMAGTSSAVSSRMGYTPTGQLAWSTDPLNQTTRLDYTQGCLTRLTNPLGKSTQFICNGAGQTIAVIDALFQTTEMHYFGADLAAVVDPLGRRVFFRHDALGRVIALENEQGSLSRREYDALGRMTRMIAPDGGTTEIGYDANGNMAAVLLPNGAGITYEYDARDRLVKRTDSLGQQESWSYDKMSRITSYTDRAGQRTAYAYDALGRQTTITYHDGSQVVASYDAVDRLLSMMDTTSGTLGWQYDDFDRVIGTVSPQGQITYVYDAAGRRTSMTVAGQAAVEYRYDAGSRLTRLLQGAEAVEFEYDGIDRLIRTQLPNGIQAGYAYDAGSQLTGLAWQKGNGNVLGALGYAYDMTGKRVAQTGSLAQQALPLANADSAFDDNNRQTKYNGQLLSYDANGNLISDGSRTYQWNARNQLVGIKQNDALIASYSYDALGRRYSRTEGGQTTEYLYDGLDTVQERMGGMVTPILTGLGIDQRYARGDAANRHYFLTDALNSTRLLTDADGNVVQSYEYDPYGGTQPYGPIANPYQYTGREQDQSGLYYYRARYYHPGMGRFISEDPIGLSGGLNSYAYVGGNPISYVDPLGLVKWSGSMTGGGVAAGIGGAFYRFSLNSECVNGEQGHAEVVAVGPTIGAEIKGVPPFSLTTSNVTLYDELDHVDPSVMNGWFSMWSAGITVFGGYGVAMIQLGGDGGSLSPPERSGAYNSFEHGPSRGFEIGAGGVFGSATVVNSSISKCGCK